MGPIPVSCTTRVGAERAGPGLGWGAYIDELLQQRELGGRQAVDLYPVSDLLYRTVAVTDAGCAVVAAYDTDAYGRTLLYNGPGPDGQWFTDDDQATDNPLCPYVFTGRRYDPETGLYYYRARYYAPERGRFLSRDPIGYQAGMGLYEYAGGKPLVKLDPNGEWIVAVGIAAVLAAGAYRGYKHGPPGFREGLIPLWGVGPFGRSPLEKEGVRLGGLPRSLGSHGYIPCKISPRITWQGAISSWG